VPFLVSLLRASSVGKRGGEKGKRLRTLRKTPSPCRCASAEGKDSILALLPKKESKNIWEGGGPLA